MKTIFKIQLIIFSLLFSNGNLYSQNPETVFTGTKNKKAERLFGEGLQHFTGTDYDGASILFAKCIKLDPKYIDAWWMKAETHSLFHEYKESMEAYKNIIAINSNYPLSYFGFSRDLFASGQYQEANRNMQLYNTKKDIYGYKYKADRLKIHIEFAVEAIKNPVKFNPTNLGKNINSYLNEYYPGITADGQTLYFTRLLGDNLHPNEDFYFSKKENAQWNFAKNIGAPINTEAKEGTITLSPDGQYVFFTSCQRESYNQHCDLYLSKLDGDKWLEPKNLGAPVNSKDWDSQPSLSYNGKTLYFTSSRPGGFGKSDIWYTTYANGRWSPPINMGAEINTDEDEECPFIAADDKTLYFVSNGHPGFGNMDIFISKKGNDGRWQKPNNLGFPINSNTEERGIVITNEGKIAYISMERDGGEGGLDIYGFELPEHLRPTQTGYAKGIVFDAITKNKLAAKVELIDLSNGKTVIESYSNKLNGEFLMNLQGNKDYALNVSRDGYLFYSDNFSFKNQNSTETFILNVPLQPIFIGAKVVLKNIFFDTDKFLLKEESKIELNKLIQFLNSNPKIKIEISGHTDNQGEKKNNLILSNNRAKTVFDFLVSNTIAKERLSFKGYADNQAIADNTSEKGRATNRRTEFRIVQ